MTLQIDPKRNRFPGQPDFPPDLVNQFIYGWEVMHQLFPYRKSWDHTWTGSVGLGVGNFRLGARVET